jgi:VWFA-related protein
VDVMAKLAINRKLKSAICGKAIASRFAFSPLILCSALAMAVSSPAISQVEVVPATSAVFRDSINVELISIDVFVTDPHGNPIVDLNVEDFEVFDDGKPVTISHFAIVGSTAKTVPDEDTSVKVSTGNLSSDGHVPTAAVQEGLFPHLVVAFDSRHLTHFAKRRMMEGLRKFIEGTSIPQDQVMIMNLGAGRTHGFDVVVPFGSTLEDLEEGLHRIKKMAPGGRSVALSFRFLLDSLEQTHMEYRQRDPFANPAQFCDQVKSQWRSDIQSYSEQTKARVTDTVQRLVRQMQILSGVPGHKAFLYIGGGLELVPGEDVYAYANQICPNMFNPLDAQGNAMTTVMKRLTEAANSYRISFNAFEASSFRSSMITSAEYKYGLYTPDSTVERIRTTNLQNGLMMLASETGGKAILNMNGYFPDFEVLEKELCSYYSLGYTPSHLRYRRSYSERLESEQLEDKLVSVLVLGWGRNPLEVRLEHGVIEPIAGKKDTFIVPLSVTVPITSLVCITEQSDDSSCRVRLLMRASDEKDRMTRLFEKIYDIRVRKDTSPQEEVTFVLTNKMRGGNHRLAVGVIDDMGSTASYVVYPVSVGSS